MSDTRLRDLERRWMETGSVQDEAVFLLERVRVGDLTRVRLELAAYCGHEAASRALGLQHLPTDVPAAIASSVGDDVLLAVGVGVAALTELPARWPSFEALADENARPLFERAGRWPPPARTGEADILRALRRIERWLACPCPPCRDACVEIPFYTLVASNGRTPASDAGAIVAAVVAFIAPSLVWARLGIAAVVTRAGELLGKNETRAAIAAWALNDSRAP
jgi:hypothetical protein